MAYKFEGFDWDAGNWPKCGKHGVTREEIEEVFKSPYLTTDDPFPGETRIRAVGKLSTGRYLFIVFTLRLKDGIHYIRPLSARYMHQKEVSKYEATVQTVARIEN